MTVQPSSRPTRIFDSSVHIVSSSSESLERELPQWIEEHARPRPMPGHELIARIDALGFTPQDQDDMMRAIQEGRRITYEDWGKELFD